MPHAAQNEYYHDTHAHTCLTVLYKVDSVSHPLAGVDVPNVPAPVFSFDKVDAFERSERLPRVSEKMRKGEKAGQIDAQRCQATKYQ